MCFDFDLESRFEFHGEVVGEDGDFLVELFDQSLIEVCDADFPPVDMEVILLWN